MPSLRRRHRRPAGAAGALLLGRLPGPRLGSPQPRTARRDSASLHAAATAAAAANLRAMRDRVHADRAWPQRLLVPGLPPPAGVISPCGRRGPSLSRASLPGRPGPGVGPPLSALLARPGERGGEHVRLVPAVRTRARRALGRRRRARAGRGAARPAASPGWIRASSVACRLRRRSQRPRAARRRGRDAAPSRRATRRVRLADVRPLPPRPRTARR